LARRRLLQAVSGITAASLWPLQAAQAQKVGTAVADAGTYQPQTGQAGKDVIWVPTPDSLVKRMLQLGGVSRDDYVIDLGAGDGKIVIAAARDFGARGLGIEYNAEMVAHAQRLAQAAGVADRAKFEKADIFESDFSKATVITMYLLPTLNMRLRPTLMKLRPGTKLVTHAFNMGGWQPDEISRADGSTAHLWLVPANVTGKWKLHHPQGGRRLTVPMEVTRQRFQFPEGTVDLSGVENSLRDARVIGDRLRFALTGTDGVVRSFNGRVNGARIEGEVHDGRHSERFSAERESEGPAIDVTD
jgi:SAM-dependent methyltransferase